MCKICKNKNNAAAVINCIDFNGEVLSKKCNYLPPCEKAVLESEDYALKQCLEDGSNQTLGIFTVTEGVISNKDFNEGYDVSFVEGQLVFTGIDGIEAQVCITPIWNVSQCPEGTDPKGIEVCSNCINCGVKVSGQGVSTTPPEGKTEKLLQQSTEESKALKKAKKIINAAKKEAKAIVAEADKVYEQSSQVAKDLIDAASKKAEEITGSLEVDEAQNKEASFNASKNAIELAEKEGVLKHLPELTGTGKENQITVTDVKEFLNKQ